MEDQIRSHLEVLEAAPGDAGAFRALEALYETASRWEDLVALYEGRARLLPEPGARPGLLAKAAGLARGRLRNVARAEELYRQLLETDPNDASALRALEALLEDKDDWPGVAAIVEREAQNATDPAEAARLTLRLGRIHEERLGRRDRASLLYARACRLDPSLDEARARALACYVALRRFAQAKRTLDALRDAGGDRKMLAVEYARLGAALADEPVEHDLAMDALVEALALDRAAPGAAELRDRLRAVPRTWREEIRALDARIGAARDRREAATLHLRAGQLHAAYDPDGAPRVAERVERAWALAPGNPVALELLERAWAERGDWRGLADALGRLAASTRDRAAQVALHVRIAQVDLVRFGDPALALASLERALDLDPASETAALQAFELHLNAGAVAEALAVVERHLAATPEKPAHAALRTRAAALAQEALGDGARARRHLEAALRVDPGHGQAAAALAPLLAEAGEWQKLVDVLEARLRTEPDAAERVRILERIAEVEQQHLDHPRDALHALSRALALDPRRAATRKGMEAAAARAGALAELARAYRSASAAVDGDDKLRKSLLRRVAEIHERDLVQPEEAVKAWREVVALDPADKHAAAALEECLARAGRHQEVARSLEETIASSQGTQRRDAQVKLARLWLDAGDTARAAAAWRALVEATPDDLDALWGLHAALEATPGARAAEERIQILARLAARAKGHAERAALDLERAELLADVLGRLGEAAGVALGVLQAGGITPSQQGQAVGLLDRLLARGVDPLRIAQVLAPWFAAAGEPERQVAMLEVIARHLPPEADARERARTLLDAAAVRTERLGDPRGALSDAAAALRACPDHAEVRRLCERLTHEVGAYGELFALLVEAASRLESRPDEERSLRMRAAAIAEQELGSPEDAAAQLRRCLELRPGDPDALAALTRSALAADRWTDAASLLGERADAAQGSERAALLAQQGEVLLERVQDARAASDAFRAAAAVAAPEQRPRLLARLADALAAAGDDVGRAAALAELAAETKDPVLAAKASLESARLQAGMGDALGAIERLRGILEAQPEDAAALAELERRLEDPDPEVVLTAARALAPVQARRGDARRRIDALEAEARACPVEAGRAAAKREISRAWELELKQLSLAFAAMADAVRATPADAELRRELRRLGEAAEDPDGCARVYDEIVAAAPADAAVAIQREQADWLEKQLGATDRAADVWGRVLASAPGDAEALGALRRLHRARERWADVAHVCEEVARRGAPGARAEALRELAEVAEARLGDAERAAAAWREVAASSPGDPDAEAALVRLAERLDRPDDLAAALERRLSRAFDGDAALRLAELKRTRLDDPPGAVALLRSVLEADPARPAARDALVALAATPGDAGREALDLVDRALAAAGENARRVEAREARLAATTDPAERARMLAELRAILERDIREPAMAFVAACRAFAEGGAARAGVEVDLVRLAAATRSFDELAAIYEDAAPLAPPDEMVALLRRAARVREHEMQDAPGAIAAWKRVLEESQDDPEALEGLERLYRAGRSARELFEIARRRARLAGGAERLAHLLEVASLAESLGDIAAAIDAFGDARALDPRNIAALEGLARLFAREGRAAEQGDVLAALAEAVRDGDPARRLALLAQRAALLEHDPDLSGAIDAWADVLAESPRDPLAIAGIERLVARPEARASAARLLEDVHRLAGDAKRLAAVLEIRLEDADEHERVPLLAELAALRERLGEGGAAFRAKLRQYRATLRDGADDPSVRAELERLALGAGAFEDLAGAFEDALASGLQPGPALEVKRRLGAICADRLQRLDAAAAWWEDVAAEAPNAEAFGALARVYRRQGKHRDLARTLSRLADASTASAVKKELLLEVAKIMDEHLSDRDGAVEAYRKILAVDPEDPNALRLLGNLLGSAERWEDLAEVLSREVSIADRRPNLVAEAAELRFRLARIRQERLADADGALQCYEEILAKVPRHPAALAALEGLARSSGAVALQAAALLEPIYASEGEHAKLIDTLEARAANETQPGLRAALLRRIAEIYGGPLRNPEMAFVAAGRALAADPDAKESLAIAVRFSTDANATEELEALLLENADRARDPGARAEYQRWIARTARNDPGRAAEAWQRVLDVVPDDHEAIAGLTASLRDAGDAAALAQALRRALAIEENAAARVKLFSELAQLLEERLGDAAGAVQALKRQLELDPSSRDALTRLDRLCVKSEKWVELADVLSREIAAADAARDAAAAVQLRYRLAELKESRLLDKVGALSLYEEVLSARPDHPETVARLEAILQRDPTNARAAALLEGAYATGGSWAKKAAVLEVRAGERPDPLERKALWIELADIRVERLQAPELAFLALCKAFREDPADSVLRARLEALAETSGHLEELAAIYEDEMDRLPPADTAQVALKLASLYEGELAGLDQAMGFYRRALALDPAVAPQALAALERLAQRLEQWPDLADVLASRAEAASGPEKVTLLFRLGQLCAERLESPDRAAEAYEAALATDPAHVPSLRALEAFYEGAGRREDLYRNLGAQRAAAKDVASKERILPKMAALGADLGRGDEAVELWKELLAVKPRHEQALAALEELHGELERWSDLAQHLRVRIQATVDRREIARLNDKLGWILGTKLGDAAQAISSFKAVLDSDPRNRRALESLRDIYAAQDDLDGLAGTYRRLVPLQEDATGVKAVRLRLAEVLLRAGHKQEATEQAKRAFDIEPHQIEELVRIEEVFRGAGAAADGVRAAEARAALLAASGGPAEAVPAWFAVADLWRTHKRPEAAAAALEKVLELDPPNRGAYDQLRELHAGAGNWRAYTRVCDLYAPQLADPAEKLELLKEVAGIHEKKLGQKEMSFLAWCRALGEAPGDAEVLGACKRLAAETEAEEELAAVLEQVSEDARGMEKARLLLELGKVRDGKLDDLEGAEAAFRRALEADPASPEALEALTELFRRRGRVRDVVITLEQKLEAAASLEEKKATLLEVAKIYDGELNDVEEAIAALRRVLELDGGDAAAVEALSAIYRREQRWTDLVGILARARDLAGSDEPRIGFQSQVAAVYENEIVDDEAAVDAYRAVVGMDDANQAALLGLERLYTKLDRFAELNKIYEKQLSLTEDPRERVRLLAKSAGIFEEKLHDLPRAIARNEEILRLDGGHLPAVKALERLYREQRLWDKLISVMQHHLTLVQDRRETVALEVAIGEVWWKEMSRVDRAEAIFNHALQLDPESREAVSALGRVYERSGNWNLALDMMRREARIAGGSKEAVDVHVRMGKIHEDMLMDVAAAKEAYGRALQLEPGCLDALRATKGIQERERDRDGYLGSLEAEARYAEDPAEQTRLLSEAGRIYQEERDDRDEAARLYEEALRRTPGYLPAARPLSDIYVTASRWQDAERVLEAIVEELAVDGEPKELCRQAYRLGYVSEKLGARDKALRMYRRAYELDATYLPALEGLGNLLVQEKQWEEALRIYTAILIHHRDGLTDLEVVETHWQIGEISANLEQVDRAVKSFEKALEIDGGHEPSRRSLVRLLEGLGDWEGAVEHRQRLVPVLEGQAKLEMYMAIGETCRDKLHDPYQAIDAFLGASRIDPASLQVTEALLGLYRETRQGQKAADVLTQILARPEVKAEPARAAQLHFSLGEILRDEVKDEDAAIVEFERALDANPRLVKAFAATEEIVTRSKRWNDLEQAYVRMIQRLPKTADVAQARLGLWKTLGELYRNVLENEDGARMAYQVVAKADPEDAAAAELYAELSAKKPGQEPEAIAAYRQLLRIGAKPQKAASALVALHAARKEYDQAYSAAQVLAILLGGATPEEQQVVSRLRKFARDQASRTLDDAAWSLLLHDRARGPLAEIMTLVALHARAMFTQQPRDLGLNPKKEELDVDGSMLFFVNMFKYVSRTLGLGGTRLFRKQEPGARLQLVPTDPPALAASEEMFQERPKKELWFGIAKALAFRRPELYMARLMPHDQLDLVFQAACSLGTSRFVVTADPHMVEKLKLGLERALPENVRKNTLKALARRYTEVQHPGDVRAYLDGAELTSNRAAALLAGDLEVVRRGVMQEKAQVSKLRDDAKTRDLVLFCTSDEYAKLREKLGLSVVVPT